MVESTGERDVLYQGNYLSLVRIDGWEFADRPGIDGVVVILAVTNDDRLVLTEQYRKPVDINVIELPAGLVGDVPGAEAEEFVVAAKRELEEETGYVADEWSELTAGPTSAGLCTEIATFFRAKGLMKQGPGGGDDHEEITVHEIPLTEIDGWLRTEAKRGSLIDPKVYTGLYFLLRERSEWKPAR
jgi:ADP-ribose pyrophosphatase